MQVLLNSEMVVLSLKPVLYSVKIKHLSSILRYFSQVKIVQFGALWSYIFQVWFI